MGPLELYEYARLDAVGLSDLIRAGEVTPTEVESVARAAIAQADADLGALTLPMFDPALDHRSDGQLAGVPFVIKDSGPFAEGVPFTLGSRSIRGAVATVDHDLMARFRSAGLVTLGQTNAPEFGLNFATEPVRFGPTRNPWARGRGVGGSSGGSAALVAAGAVPLAHGNDGAGSLRVPASCCGLVGLKPSRGRIPCGPLVGEAGFGHIYEFALARTVRDTARLLDVVGTPPVGEKYAAPPQAGSYSDAMRVDPGRLRVALTTEPWGESAVHPQVSAAVVAAGGILEWIGHTVTEDRPQFDAEDVVEASMLTAVSTGAAILRAPRRPDPALLEAVSRTLLQETAAFTALDVAAALDAAHRVTRSIGEFFTRFDLLVTPTVAWLPVPHGTLDYNDPRHSVRSWLRRIFEFGPFTAPLNVSGHPAISVPLAMSREGLPIGIHLVAATGREDLLLQVAAQLEQAVPWKDRQPSIFVD